MARLLSVAEYMSAPIGPAPGGTKVFAVPTAITFTPSSPVIFDNNPIGTNVAAVTVTMNDGSTFTGGLRFDLPFSNDGGLFNYVGNELVTNALLPPGPSTQNVTVTASQNGTTIQANLAITVQRAQTSPSQFTVDITGGPYGSTVYTFSGATAVDRGTYVGEFVNQRSWELKNSSLPEWTVHLRLDTDAAGNVLPSPRVEFVFELGSSELFGTPVAPYQITSPFTATIKQNGVPITGGFVGNSAVLNPSGIITVPKQWWQSRWRWQSSLRPIVRNVAMLQSRKWVFPYGSSGLYGANALNQLLTYDYPMSRAGLDANMGDPGDRNDIGFHTGWTASYLIFGDANSFTTMMSQAEAAGSISMFFRDSGGALVNIFNYGFITTDNNGTNQIIKAAPPVDSDFISWEAAHQPDLSFVPWALTDDPYFLENKQAQANLSLLWSIFFASKFNLKGIVSWTQTRTFGWGMREVFQALLSSPSSTPAWLLPKSYWQSVANNNLTGFNQVLNSPALIYTRFHVLIEISRPTIWEESFITGTVGWALEAGIASAWASAFAYMAAYQMQFADGTNGWPRGWPAPFKLRVVTTVDQNGNPGIEPPILNTSLDSVTETNLASVWSFEKTESEYQAYIAAGGAPDSTWDGTAIHEPVDVSYVYQQRAAIVMAMRNGISGAAAQYNWIQSQIPIARAAQGVSPSYWNFSLDPGTDKLQALLATMPAGSWKSVANTNLSAVGYSGPFVTENGGFPPRVMDPWSGAIYDPDDQIIIVCGGGHTDYRGNELYAFSLPNLSWSRLCEPNDFNTYNLTTDSGLFPDGRALLPHTYDSIAYDKGNRTLVMNGAGRAQGGGTARQFTFDIAGALANPGQLGRWTQLPDNTIQGGVGNTSDIFKYDANLDKFWRGGGNINGIYQWSRTATGTWTQFGNTPLPFGTSANEQGQCGAIDLIHKRLYAIGCQRLTYYSIDTVGGTAGQQTTVAFASTGTPQDDFYPGVIYHSPTGDLVVCSGALAPTGGSQTMSNNLFRLNTTTHTWSMATMTGDPVGASAGQGTFGRFQYIPAPYNCFFLVNSVTGNVLIGKPNF